MGRFHTWKHSACHHIDKDKHSLVSRIFQITIASTGTTTASTEVCSMAFIMELEIGFIFSPHKYLFH